MFRLRRRKPRRRANTLLHRRRFRQSAAYGARHARRFSRRGAWRRDRRGYGRVHGLGRRARLRPHVRHRRNDRALSPAHTAGPRRPGGLRRGGQVAPAAGAYRRAPGRRGRKPSTRAPKPSLRPCRKKKPSRWTTRSRIAAARSAFSTPCAPASSGPRHDGRAYCAFQSRIIAPTSASVFASMSRMRPA